MMITDKLRPRLYKPRSLFSADFDECNNTIHLCSGMQLNVDPDKLRPKQYKPKPLSTDFDNIPFSKEPMVQLMDNDRESISEEIAKIDQIDGDKQVDTFMRQNKYTFDAAALKKATRSLNITDNQYPNLVSLNFDESSLLDKINAQRLNARRNIINSTPWKKLDSN